ncbi:MAG: helix-turn-helix domain-containing protein [Phycisphaera sp.]|nr:helix-turn-helix domain-containing protein [Phycisphaera sp.]
MANFAGALKEEIKRLSKRVVRAEMSTPRRLVSQHRRDLAGVKRMMAKLQRQVASLEKAVRKGGAVVTGANDAAYGDASSVRFSPNWVKKHRAKLGISAADYAKLVGVSPLTIYHWEQGKSRPRNAQLQKWAAMREMGKRDIVSALGRKPGSRRSRKK